MTPLIDCDILRYEVGSWAEYKIENTDEDGNVFYTDGVRDFDAVAERLHEKVEEICAEVWATEPPIMFLTLDRTTAERLNRRRVKEGKKEKVFKPNFREEVAVTKPYKGNRKKKAKPVHYDNLTAYIMATYKVVMAEGLEADDMLSVYQMRRIKELDTIICSRDKDLRITPGMHFGWEVGNQPQFGPKQVTELGTLEMKKNGKDTTGTGLKFFYNQLITGDSTDNIPGLPRAGAVKSFQSLSECESEEQLFQGVAELYQAKFGDEWRVHLREQADLLWMVQELDENKEPVKYVMYDER